MADSIKLLVVEDDQLIQAMIEEALSDGGFESAITASGSEAIDLLKSEISQYRAVLTDINLQGSVAGWEVARVAREVDPTIPVVYMTGTHGEEWASKGVPKSVLLLKPFAPAQLVTAVSALLNSIPPPDQQKNDC
jgi:DNA-binding response OmpR family regulator